MSQVPHFYTWGDWRALRADDESITSNLDDKSQVTSLAEGAGVITGLIFVQVFFFFKLTFNILTSTLTFSPYFFYLLFYKLCFLLV